MSSMRPPMLAGPMPRKTKFLSIGSLDQLIGVGVGLGAGGALRAGDGPCVADGVCEGTGFSARTANAPRVTAISASAQIAARSPPTSRAERDVCFIGEIPFKSNCGLRNCAGSDFRRHLKNRMTHKSKNRLQLLRIRKLENIYLI